MKTSHAITTGGKEYPLRLTTGAVMSIEKKLGKSMLTALENIEENMVETIVTILWGAMQPLNDNISFEDTMNLIDEYIDEGNTFDDMMYEVIAFLSMSGFVNGGQDE